METEWEWEAIASGDVRRRGCLHVATVLWPAPFVRRTLVRGADGGYGAMFLSCIESRFVESVRAFTAKNGLMGKYCQFVPARP